MHRWRTHVYSLASRRCFCAVDVDEQYKLLQHLQQGSSFLCSPAAVVQLLRESAADCASSCGFGYMLCTRDQGMHHVPAFGASLAIAALGCALLL